MCPTSTCLFTGLTKTQPWTLSLYCYCTAVTKVVGESHTHVCDLKPCWDSHCCQSFGLSLVEFFKSFSNESLLINLGVPYFKQMILLPFALRKDHGAQFLFCFYSPVRIPLSVFNSQMGIPGILMFFRTLPLPPILPKGIFLDFYPSSSLQFMVIPFKYSTHLLCFVPSCSHLQAPSSFDLLPFYCSSQFQGHQSLPDSQSKPKDYFYVNNVLK